MFSNSNYSNATSILTANPYLTVNFFPNGLDWIGNIISAASVQNGGKDVYLTLKRESDLVAVGQIDAHSAIGVNKIELWEANSLLGQFYP